MAELTQNQLDARTLSDFYQIKPLKWRRDWWRLWRWRRPHVLGITIFIGVVALVANLLGWGAWRHSPGPVANVHAAWENNCSACHGTPSAETTLGAIGRIPAPLAVDSARCKACHAGPPHHESCIGFEADCASCHREHRGRHARLTMVGDEHCVRCHSDLTKHRDNKHPLKFAEKLDYFSTPPAHPEFAALQPRPKSRASKQNLHFNHALHMTPGLVALHEGKPQGWPLTYADLPEADRTRYQQADPKTAVVRLNCGSCHQLDVNDAPKKQPGLPGGRWPALTPSAYPLPISYEAQCRACHPLTFDFRTPRVPAPHGQQPLELRHFLERNYASSLPGDERSSVELIPQGIGTSQQTIRSRGHPLGRDLFKPDGRLALLDRAHRSRWILSCGRFAAWQLSPRLLPRCRQLIAGSMKTGVFGINSDSPRQK